MGFSALPPPPPPPSTHHPTHPPTSGLSQRWLWQQWQQQRWQGQHCESEVLKSRVCGQPSVGMQSGQTHASHAPHVLPLRLTPPSHALPSLRALPTMARATSVSASESTVWLRALHCSLCTSLPTPCPAPVRPCSVGQGNTGTGNVGQGNSGNKNVGQGNSGNMNQGQGNSGNQNNGLGSECSLIPPGLRTRVWHRPPVTVSFPHVPHPASPGRCGQPEQWPGQLWRVQQRPGQRRRQQVRSPSSQGT